MVDRKTAGINASHCKQTASICRAAVSTQQFSYGEFVVFAIFCSFTSETGWRYFDAYRNSHLRYSSWEWNTLSWISQSDVFVLETGCKNCFNGMQVVNGLFAGQPRAVTSPVLVVLRLHSGDQSKYLQSRQRQFAVWSAAERSTSSLKTHVKSFHPEMNGLCEFPRSP